MKGHIQFQYLCAQDVVIARVSWHLETVDDLNVWFRQYETYFKTHHTRKVDLILELTNFRLNARLAPQFRELRNRILQDFTIRSYRVNEPAKERALMYAGSVLTGGPANEYESIDDALKALLEDRAKGVLSRRSSMRPAANG